MGINRKALLAAYDRTDRTHTITVNGTAQTCRKLERRAGQLEAYEEAKAARPADRPIIQRFRERIAQVREWAARYPDIEFRITTDPLAYIDAQVEQEEPAFWKAKKDKRTWFENEEVGSIYPDRFKMSDIDLNAYRDGIPLTDQEIHELLIEDEHVFVQANGRRLNLIDLAPGIRIDVYSFKGEKSTAL